MKKYGDTDRDFEYIEIDDNTGIQTDTDTENDDKCVIDGTSKPSKRKKEKKVKKERTLAQEILIDSIYLLVVFILALLIVKFVAQRTVVHGSSMYPTLSDHDNLIVDKLSYKFSDPKRFDIIVFPYRYNKKEYYIKRIIGLPGEKVRIDADGVIYINGEVLEENYGREKNFKPHDAIEEITLGEDEYFVLGDNRNNSSDSRFQNDVGNIKRKEIIGKAWIRIYPLNKIGFVKHK